MPGSIAPRCQRACVPLKRAVRACSRARVSRLPPGLMPTTTCAAFQLRSGRLLCLSPHMLLTSARFAQELDSLPLPTLVILDPSSCLGQGAEEIPSSH